MPQCPKCNLESHWRENYRWKCAHCYYRYDDNLEEVKMATTLIPVYLDEAQWNKLVNNMSNNMSMACDPNQEEIIIRTNQNFVFVCRKLVHKLYEKDDNLYGNIRLEMWKEGLVLWVGGIIKWKSFAE